MNASDDKFAQLRQILLDDWDPHNAVRSDAAAGSYDAYIDPLLTMIQAGATENEVIRFLHTREQETMCFPSLGTERLRRVARKLIRAGSSEQSLG